VPDPLSHPRHDLDHLLTHAVRFSIVAALVGSEREEFAAIRDSVEITDSALSKQVALLESAGYVDVRKGRVGRRPRTWLILTDEGAQIYQRHLAALHSIAAPSTTH
jgi:DNA-binding MarR family transcriptional regulator